jgi:hypothetical protein
MTSKIVGGIEIVVGILFLISTASDIQLGFGLVLVALGVNQILK